MHLTPGPRPSGLGPWLARQALRITPVAPVLAVALWAGPVPADDAAAGAALYAKECAGCHGPAAIGGRDGEFPRLAGLPAGYLAQQLKDFRDRKRQNKPMLPIFKAGRLSADLIADLVAYLSALPVPNPRDMGIRDTPEGDLEWGEELYLRDCALCHGPVGEGKPDTDNPPLRAQWLGYLKRQIADFRSERRGHEYREALFQEAEPDELEAILAHLVRINGLRTGG
jgi:cytochrome c553